MQRSGKDCQLKESNFINECERWRALEKETEDLWKEIREKVKTSTRKSENSQKLETWKEDMTQQRVEREEERSKKDPKKDSDGTEPEGRIHESSQRI